jgi:hypothetical protein
MLARQYRPRSRYDHDCLSIINDHRWAYHHVPNVQAIEQKHRRIIHTPDFVKVDTAPRLKLGLVFNMSRSKLGDFGVDGVAEGVECFAYAADLLKEKTRRNAVSIYSSLTAPKNKLP